MSADVLFPELEPTPPVRADWFLFDDDGFPFAIGNADYVTREEMVSELSASGRDRLARIEYVTDPERRRHLFDVHLGKAIA